MYFLVPGNTEEQSIMFDSLTASDTPLFWRDGHLKYQYLALKSEIEWLAQANWK